MCNHETLVLKNTLSAISRMGRKWSKYYHKNCINTKLLNLWSNAISEWADNDSLPLIVRKSTNNQGFELSHDTGRKLILADNSFAVWVYCQVKQQIKPFSEQTIISLLNQDEIPFSFILSTSQRKVVKYKKTLSESERLSGKLCHIEPVKLARRMDVKKIPIEELKQHFKRYADPKNMVEIPKEIGALGEITVFIKQFKYE